MQSFELGQLWEQILIKTKTQLAPPIWERALHSGLIPESYNKESKTLFLFPMHEFVRNLVYQHKNIIITIEKAASEIINHPVKVSLSTEQQDLNTISSDNEEQLDISSISSTDFMLNIDNINDDKHVPKEENFTPFAVFDKEDLTEPNLFENNSYYDEPIVISKTTKTNTQAKTTFTNNDIIPATNIKNTSLNLDSSDLNPDYTFEAFVVANPNIMAYTVALNTAEKPAELYNPLFIYGNSGLGKTHLMHAIGNKILKTDPNKKIRCISSETYMNDFINALNNKRNESFREKYRSVDVLLVDDIQFLQSKASTQEEFFHTFNALQNSHKQIVLTSDTMPSDMKGLEKRLQTRFEGGMIVTIDPPDLELCIAILRAQANIEYAINADGSYQVFDRVITRSEMNLIINTIAENVQNNIRTLEGSFTKVVSTVACLNAPITKSFVYEQIKEVIDITQSRPLDMEIIQECISSYFKIKLEDLLGSKRKKHFVYPRQIAMYLCRELVNASFPSIAESFGKKDHSTIIHAYEKIDNAIKNDKDDIRRYIEEIKAELNKRCG